MLIGLAGFAGVGKTTAAEYLKATFDGEVIYLGQVVLDELTVRGLSRTAENEKFVRNELRSLHGAGALAIARTAHVRNASQRGKLILVDAIYTMDEFELLKQSVDGSSTVLLAINASVETRELRLAKRAERSLSREQIESRDDYERKSLKIDSVFAKAHPMDNEGTLEQFQAELVKFVRGI